MKYITYKIASFICGQDLENFFNYSSARDEYYYELETKDEKIGHIREVAENLFSQEIGNKTATRIYNFLEADYDDQNERYYQLKSLKYRK
jgi:hypothetical protein